MIRDTSSTTKKPGEKVYGNAIEADLAALQRSREFAVQEQEKGHDRSALIAHYDERIAKLRNML